VDPQEIFRQAIRALRNEFVCRRGLVLRLAPLLFDSDAAGSAQVLAEEGFALRGQDVGSRTILMDLTGSLEDLRAGMRPHWKRELKLAERKALTIIEGSDDRLFETFVDLHAEMVARKRFIEGTDINQFRRIQAQLPDGFKMNIMLCQSAAGCCAGLIASAIGKTALYLFGATSAVGLKSNGSYLLQWELIRKLKERGCTWYDLNGINELRNPGTYKFKNDLAGVHGLNVAFMGRFDSHASGLSHHVVDVGDAVRGVVRKLRHRQGRGYGKMSIASTTTTVDEA
jgi:peptidoglycan pentaglycine glycine transferase (the first glycine)